ncbi:hypothetical protein PM082_008484 [Marasmius tenuissimus]|nr:hypothetical protein PM082_008484 [Marasmius tenuissimus]
MTTSEGDSLIAPRIRIHTQYPITPRKKNKVTDIVAGLGGLQLQESTPLLIDGPPHPGKGWTRFVCISDTHSNIYTVPKGDVLLHSGDLSSWGEKDQLKETINWIASLEGFQVKVLIAGNHDLCLDEWWCSARFRGSQTSPEEKEHEEAVELVTGEEAVKKGICYLVHERLDFMTKEGKKWVIYGSPAAPVYALGAFQYKNSEEAEEIYQCIPDDTDILLTHTPPHGILDKTRKGKLAGCQVLKNVLDSGRLESLRLHVFGHIHEGYGAEVRDNGTAEINAAVAWGGKPIIVDLKN